MLEIPGFATSPMVIYMESTHGSLPLKHSVAKVCAINSFSEVLWEEPRRHVIPLKEMKRFANKEVTILVFFRQNVPKNVNKITCSAK